MVIQFMKDYYDLRYEETDGENHFVDKDHDSFYSFPKHYQADLKKCW